MGDNRDLWRALALDVFFQDKLMNSYEFLIIIIIIISLGLTAFFLF